MRPLQPDYSQFRVEANLSEEKTVGIKVTVDTDNADNMIFIFTLMIGEKVMLKMLKTCKAS